MTEYAEPLTRENPAPSGPDRRLRTRMLIAIGVVLAVAALRWSEPVTLPLTVAVFLLVLTRPLQCWLEQRSPKWLAVIVTTLTVLLAVAVIAGAVVLGVGQVATRAPEMAERLQIVAEQARRWAQAHGLPVPAAGGEMGERLFPVISRLVRSGGVTLERLGLILAFFILGLLEVSAFCDKARERLRAPHGDALVEGAAETSRRVRRYLGALTITSLISGVATGLFTLAVGLDSPLIWGLVAFLLNYVPTIGPFVAVVPPTLYALLQFGSLGRTAVVFFGVGAIQFFIGNFLDPKIEGRVLSLSPLVVLVSVVFWGWMWGVLGALLAVPLTVALVDVCDRFQRSRWVSALLSE